MKASPTAIYKITRPRFRLVMARKRLFDLLDRSRGCPIVWISGPAGSGKTALVASYLDARRDASVWYQLDAGDAEVGTFFYCLGIAAEKAASRRKPPLPVLTPEYAGDVSAFTRAYFDELFTRLRKPAVIVLDNYQDVPYPSRLHDIIRDGLPRIPPGVSAVIVSREGPPPAMARLLAENRIASVGWDDLRLTLREARDIIRLYSERKPPREAVEKLHARTGGWAAGLVMASRIVREGADLSAVLSGIPPEGMFDYFAGEVFNKFDKAAQDFLLKISLAPHITAQIAGRLTGHESGGPLLAELNRKNCFMEKRRSEAEPTYCFHPLFREFLLSRAHARYSSAEIARLKKRAAVLFMDSGDAEDAARLLTEAGHWSGLAELIHRSARGLLTQGRNAVLHEWIMNVPEQLRDSQPRLLYWRGLCRLPFDPAGARLFLEKAFRRFNAKRDAAGAFLSWAGIVESITHELGALHRLDRWIALFDRLVKRYRRLPGADVEDQVASHMFAALTMRRPGHPEFDRWQSRAFALIEKDANPALQMLTGFYLFTHHVWSGEYAMAGQILKRLQAMASGSAPPLARITVKQAEAWYEWGIGRHDVCMQAIGEGLELAEKSGVHLWDYSLMIQGVVSFLSRGDRAGAEELLSKLSAVLGKARGFDKFYYYHERAWLSLLEGDLATAFSHQEKALAFADEAGIAYGRAQARYGLSQILHESGKVRAAERMIREVRRIGKESNSPVIEFISLLAEARLLLDGARTDRKDARAELRGLQILRKALTTGRQRGFRCMLWWWRPPVMADLLGTALEHDIEVEYVRDLVSRHGLVPDGNSADLEHWPWRLKIYTLGRFEIREGDKPLRFSRKSPRKPLELIKALVSFGGKEVRDDRIYDALWPGADGSAARQAFATTLKRVRRLIGDKQALALSEGRLTLHPGCWVDAHAFERLVDRADAEWSRTPAIKVRSRAARLSEQAIALYRGAFLSGDNDQLWTEPYREKLRRKYIRSLESVGVYWQEAGEHRKAAECFRKGLEVEELAEEFYRRLMECYQRLGRRADACAVYERCRKTLSSRIGIGPSPETEALHAALRRKA